MTFVDLYDIVDKKINNPPRKKHVRPIYQTFQTLPMEKRCNQCNTISKEQAQECCAFDDCPHKTEVLKDQSGLVITGSKEVPGLSAENTGNQDNAPGSSEELLKNRDEPPKGNEISVNNLGSTEEVSQNIEGNAPGNEQLQ